MHALSSANNAIGCVHPSRGLKAWQADDVATALLIAKF